MSTSDRQKNVEIIAVILTGLGKFLLMDLLNLRFLYISVACLFWGSYIFYQYRQNKGVLSYWGLSKKNFRQTFLELLPIALLSVALFIFIGNKTGTNILNWSILPILLLYPIWGIIQQFIIVGLLAGNLKRLEYKKIPNWLIVLITSIIFGIVHYPYWVLIGGTFLLAVVYTSLYLRDRNLIVMGIYHGWLGAFFFYTIMGRDPWQEVFAKLFL